MGTPRHMSQCEWLMMNCGAKLSMSEWGRLVIEAMLLSLAHVWASICGITSRELSQRIVGQRSRPRR